MGLGYLRFLNKMPKWKRTQRQTLTYAPAPGTDDRQVVGSRQLIRFMAGHDIKEDSSGIVVLSHNHSKRRRQIRAMERIEGRAPSTFGSVSITMPGHRNHTERRALKSGYSVHEDGNISVRKLNNRRQQQKRENAVRREALRRCNQEIGQNARAAWIREGKTQPLRRYWESASAYFYAQKYDQRILNQVRAERSV